MQFNLMYDAAKQGYPALHINGIGLALVAVGVLLVLAPETLAAVRSAVRNRMQVSLNLAYGSAMASIGLTIPTIAVRRVR